MKRKNLLALGMVVLITSQGWSETFTVTNDLFEGPGSLKQAVLDSNAAGGSNTILWSGPGGSFQPDYIPAITTDLLIDGGGATSPVVIDVYPELDIHAGTTRLANVTFDFGYFTKKGAGTLIACVQGNHDHTRVEDGTLAICSGSNLGKYASVSLAGNLRALDNLTIGTGATQSTALSAGGGAEIDTNGFDITVNGIAYFYDSEKGAVKTGAGRLLLIGEPYPFYDAGKLRIDEGEVVTNASNLQRVNITNNALLTFQQDIDGFYGSSLSGTGMLVKTGDATLTLGGKNSYSGGTLVAEGTVIGTTESLQGDIVNNGSVIFARPDSFSDLTGGTYAGSMSGTGSLHVSSDFSLTLTGRNTLQGETIIERSNFEIGSLMGTTESLPSTIINNGRLIIDQDFDGTYRGNLAGSGIFMLHGSNAITLAGTNEIAGLVYVDEATLTVGSPRALGSLSEIALSNQGSLDLGGFNSEVRRVQGGNIRLRLGTLTTNDGANLSGLETWIANATSYGKIISPHSIGIDGLLKVRVLDPSAIFNPQQPLTIVEADGGVFGEFQDIEQPAATHFDVVYTPNSVELHVAYVPFAQTALGQNQSGVAAALDQIRATNWQLMSEELGVLSLLNTNQLRSAFSQITPTALSSLSGMTFATADSQSAGLRRRFEGLRAGEGAGHFAVYDTRAKNPVLAVVADAGADLNGMRTYRKDAEPESKWGFFGSANGTFGRLSAIDNTTSTQPGYDFSSNGFTVGADQAVSDNLVLGLSGGFQSGESQLDFGAGDSEVKSIQLGLYGSLAGRRSSFVNTFVGGSFNSYETRRSIPLFDRTAQGSPNGVGAAAMMEAGVDRRWGKSTLTPSVSVEYAFLRVDSFQESGAGALNLNVAEQNAQSLRTVLGGRWSREMGGTTGVRWRPSMRLGWMHEYKNDSRSIAAQFSAGGNSFSVDTSHAGQDAMLLGFGLHARFTPGVGGYIDYETELARDNLTAQTVNGGVRLSF